MTIRSDYKDYIQTYFNSTVFDGVPAQENPQITAGFIDYILNTPDLSYEYATVLMATLPSQRYSYYSDSNIDKIKQNVLTELNKINEALGFFNIASKPNLL